MLLTDLHEDVSRKVLNGLKRKTSRQKAFLKLKTAEIFFCRLLELSLRNPGANFCTVNFASENVVHV